MKERCNTSSSNYWTQSVIAIQPKLSTGNHLFSRDVQISHVLFFRDIKLDSCAVKHLYKDKKKYAWVKICDFEYCKNIKHNSMPKSLVGTAAYLCLDIIESRVPGVDKSTYQGEPVDVWNLGISLYYLLEGCFPFGTGTIHHGF